MCTHYTLLRMRNVQTLLRNARCTFETAKCARSKQRSVHVRNSEVRTFERSEVRTYDLLRKSVLRSFRMRKRA